jgi:hypothetical protein
MTDTPAQAAERALRNLRVFDMPLTDGEIEEVISAINSSTYPSNARCHVFLKILRALTLEHGYPTFGLGAEIDDYLFDAPGISDSLYCEERKNKEGL